MCGWEVWERNHGNMSKEVFDRILEECKINGLTSMRFSCAQGEPLLNPRWGEYADKAIASGLHLNINTNCTPLTSRNIAKLKQVSETGQFTIQLSFAGWDKESYEKVYAGADFEATSRKVKLLWEAIGPLNDYSGHPVFTVRGICYNQDAIHRSRDYLVNLGIAKDRVYMFLPDNFAGRVEIVKPKVDGRKPLCYILTDHIGVYDDGTVTACASRDSESVMKLGNILDSGFRELRDSPAYKAMVAAFHTQDFSNSPLCKGCDLPYG
jgi:MoaA/NifB/PqqE/SkfB family radical SAM enzyme